MVLLNSAGKRASEYSSYLQTGCGRCILKYGTVRHNMTTDMLIKYAELVPAHWGPHQVSRNMISKQFHTQYLLPIERTVELGVLVPYPEEGREAKDHLRPSALCD